MTINNFSPALDRQFQEVALIEKYLQFAAADFRKNQGHVTSGNIIDNSNTVMGNRVYTPQAGS